MKMDLEPLEDKERTIIVTWNNYQCHDINIKDKITHFPSVLMVRIVKIYDLTAPVSPS